MVEIHVRHGQASGEFGWGLTPIGIQQAELVGDYIRKHFPMDFKVSMHSGSRRAVQTAEKLGLSNLSWIKEERLREADWAGKPEPQDFMEWKKMYERVASVCEEVDKNFSNQNRIVVSHGGTLRMVRVYRENFDEEKFTALFQPPYKYFTNCQIIIYTNVDPATGKLTPNSLWVKSVCPWDETGRFGHDWLLVPAREQDKTGILFA